MNLFSISNLYYQYPQREKTALRIDKFTIQEGEFILVVGESGSGKSTLARVLGGLVPHFYGGTISGKAEYRDRSLLCDQTRQFRTEVGMVFQDPEKQVVMAEVERELAFGLENLGTPLSVMRRRVTEVVNYLGLEALVLRETRSLSSGELQRVVLGSVLATLPHVLILDEPTSQLSPTAARDVLGLIERLNRDEGITVILIEQRLDDAFLLADRVVQLEKGQIILDAPPAKFIEKAKAYSLPYIPLVSKLSSLANKCESAWTIKDARQVLKNCMLSKKCPQSVGPAIHHRKQAGDTTSSRRPVIEFLNVSFSYDGRSIFDRLNLQVFEGEIVSILGENGAGKSTLLKLVCGVLEPSAGSLLVHGKPRAPLGKKNGAYRIGYLSQDPSTYLLHDTVEEELRATAENFGVEDDTMLEVLEFLNLLALRERYPRDLSTGERERVALGSVLAAEPKILLLDEPTRGCDLVHKAQLKLYLKKLLGKTGMTIMLVTQDVDLAAECSSRSVILSRGQVITEGPTTEVLCGNLFYSTQTNRLFRGVVDDIVSYDQAEALLRSFSS